MAEMRVAPADLVKLARSTLETTKALGAAQIDTQAQVSVGPAAFGGVLADTELYGAHQAAAEAADSVLEGLVSTLEQDADNLYRIAFRYKDMDEEAADRIRRTRTVP